MTTVKFDDDGACDYNDYDNCNYRIVQLSHYSVKEFLTSEHLAKGDLSQYFISPEPVHTVLAQICIGTLLQPDLHIGDITDSFLNCEMSG